MSFEGIIIEYDVICSYWVYIVFFQSYGLYVFSFCKFEIVSLQNQQLNTNVSTLDDCVRIQFSSRMIYFPLILDDVLRQR